MIDLRKEENVGLKNFTGGIQCYVSKNQIAQAYASYLASKNDSPATEQDINMTNTLIEGLSNNALVALWNVLHGFKQETFIKKGDCFSTNMPRKLLIEVMDVNETEGECHVEGYVENHDGSIHVEEKIWRISEFSTLKQISSEEFNALLEEWKGMNPYPLG